MKRYDTLIQILEEPEVAKALHTYCKSTGRTHSALIRFLIREYLTKEGVKV